ncbi:hypothetical protein NDU88_006912 [Pleurodeles waltl]|uniref:Tachylectin 2 domain-containing protein n=1 Tax=Pleurodeles waltl TaxID=8319 RepID=A0AAV7WHP7_PLEWA|nr:hypothetical protein NDU88_006912 [Pleurodeles waltl]
MATNSDCSTRRRSEQLQPVPASDQGPAAVAPQQYLNAGRAEQSGVAATRCGSIRDLTHFIFSADHQRPEEVLSAMSKSDVILFTVDNEGVGRAGLPPAAYLDDYKTRAIELGRLSALSHVFFSPDGDMYAVKGSEIYKGPMPTNPSKNWFQDTAKRVGKTDWGRFKRLFFHPDGTLYGVTHEGELYKGSPPTNENVSWLYTQANKIGNAGWEGFYALFFDPQGILYAVTEDKFVKKSPPTSANEDWFAASQAIGTGGWSGLSHFMSFSPDGKLWCVSKDDGKIYTASPPTEVGENWIERAQNLGHSFLFKFMAFTRDRTLKSIVTFDFQPEVGKILSTVPEVVAQQVYDNKNSTSTLNSVFSFNKTISSESSFSHAHGITIGVDADVSFKTGIPFIAEGEVKIGISASTTHNWSFNEVNKTETTYTMSQTFQVAPGKAVRQKAVLQKAKLTIPYVAKIRTLFNYEVDMKGTWEGVTYFNLSVVQEDV